MVAGRLLEQSAAVLDTAALGVGRAKVKPPHPGKRDRCRAHRTWLERHVEIAAVEAFRFHQRAGSPDDQHFGMSGWIIVLARAIAGAGQNQARAIDDHGAHGHFAAVASGFGLSQRRLHMAYRARRCHNVAMVKQRPKTQVNRDEPQSRPGEPMRIAKAIARAGLCSRREAERWIADGRVNVNGRVLTTPAVEVAATDVVRVDGRPLPNLDVARLWRYHKPKGLVTTHADPQGRPTVFEKMPPELPRVISIGRLDYNTEGLLLLTNDGGLARHMELPATGWVRRYRVRAKGRVTPADLENLKAGLELEGVRYGPVEAVVDTVQGANMWLTIAIREGKNREVRNILSHLGVEVNRLIRISFGPFQLLDLGPGSVEQVKRRTLAEQLGPKLAQDFGLAEGVEDRKARHARGKAAQDYE